MEFAQTVLIIVQHASHQLNAKSVRMGSNYKKVNVYQFVLKEHLLKKESVLIVQKVVQLAKMKKHV